MEPRYFKNFQIQQIHSLTAWILHFKIPKKSIPVKKDLGVVEINEANILWFRKIPGDMKSYGEESNCKLLRDDYIHIGSVD